MNWRRFFIPPMEPVPFDDFKGAMVVWRKRLVWYVGFCLTLFVIAAVLVTIIHFGFKVFAR
jgi:hypothetical protein